MGKCIITPHICHRGVILKGEYAYYLRFQVAQRFNNLISLYNEKSWSSKQQEIYDLVKLLHDQGLGYRKIAQYLNERGIKTAKGNEWKNSQVYSVFKRYAERAERRKIIETNYEAVWSKMWLEYS